MIRSAPSSFKIASSFGRVAVGGLCLLSLMSQAAVAQDFSQGVVGRPTHATLEACLANWDRDAESDGWRAQVMLLDKHSRPAPLRAHATFELVARVPSPDRTHYVDAPGKTMRWWKQLEFNAAGVAEVQLPKRVAEPRGLLGQSSRAKRFAPRPRWAVLRVRVSVPTVGVLESVAPVAFAEPLLVDSDSLGR
ncbi:hypothetical protein [Roseimaritima ulvae]|uniref:Uncharacterized protein n=1 Tax=Roseimaritima ulvae TaxID=980254 RepID=A0A5B9QZK9_9BACT|nr:hypothetical protein [Roseimaritima ulvae]QEG43340.1 hypothetical protein UC8_53870 [Roseimaritima ulvae]